MKLGLGGWERGEMTKLGAKTWQLKHAEMYNPNPGLSGGIGHKESYNASLVVWYGRGIGSCSQITPQCQGHMQPQFDMHQSLGLFATLKEAGDQW
jgi:hypothetical protein